MGTFFGTYSAGAPSVLLLRVKEGGTSVEVQYRHLCWSVVEQNGKTKQNKNLFSLVDIFF